MTFGVNKPSSTVSCRHQIFLTLVMVGCFLLQIPQTIHVHQVLSFQAPEEGIPIQSATDTQRQPTIYNGNSYENEDWFDRQAWEIHNVTKDSCFSLERVCHERMQWFYDGSLRQDQNDPAHNQPMPFIISNEKTLVPEAYFPKTFHIRNRINDTTALSNCQYSAIPHHLVLHGHFSIMMGEFFARVLSRLSVIFHKVLQTDRQRKLFVDSTQLYLQINKKKRHLLEGHEMFLSLFSRHQALSYAGLLDSSHNIHCQCFEHLTFCGYEKAQGRKIRTRNPDGLSLVPSTIGAPNTKKHGYKELQHHIFQEFVADRPGIQTEINTWRKNLLNHASDNESWTLVGLAQREGRRRWRNMTEVIEDCNKWGLQYLDEVAENKNRRKVRCVEVNVELEDMQNPYQHLLAHASLDALIGIHGAQLTDGVLMKPGSVLVELLPFIPSKKDTWGGWTNFAHKPTPVGDMFHNTDLNHIGVPLTIDSISHETCATKETYTVKCFEKDENKWSNRGFLFDGSNVIHVLEQLVVPLTRKQSKWNRVQNKQYGMNSIYDFPPEPIPCQELIERAGDDYVLYNVHCVDTTGDDSKENDVNATVHHFYRHPDWLFHKTVPNPL